MSGCSSLTPSRPLTQQSPIVCIIFTCNRSFSNEQVNWAFLIHLKQRYRMIKANVCKYRYYLDMHAMNYWLPAQICPPCLITPTLWISMKTKLFRNSVTMCQRGVKTLLGEKWKDSIVNFRQYFILKVSVIGQVGGRIQAGNQQTW